MCGTEMFMTSSIWLQMQTALMALQFKYRGQCLTMCSALYTAPLTLHILYSTEPELAHLLLSTRNLGYILILSKLFLVKGHVGVLIISFLTPPGSSKKSNIWFMEGIQLLVSLELYLNVTPARAHF